MATNKESEIAINVKVEDNASKQLKGINDQVSNTGKVANTSSQGTNLFGGALSAVSKIASSIIVAQILTKVFNAIVDIGTASFESAFNLSEFNAKLGTIFQDNQTKIDEFNKSVNSFGFDIPNQEIDQIREYALSLVNVGYSTSDTEKLLKQLGDVTLVVGKEKFGTFIEVLKKVGERGHMTAREFLLMQTSGIDLGSAIGVSDEKLQEMVDNGQVGVKDLQKAFEKLTGAGGKYAGATERYNKSLAGSWDDVVDKVDRLKESIGEKLTPIISTALDWINNTWKTLQEKFTPVWDRLKPIFDSIGSSLNIIFSTIGTAFNGPELKGLGEQLNTAFSDWLVQQVQDFATKLKEFCDWLATPDGVKMIESLKQVVENTAIMFQNLVNFFTDPATKKAFDDIIEMVKQITNPFYNFYTAVDKALKKWEEFTGVKSKKVPTNSNGGTDTTELLPYVPYTKIEDYKNALGTSFFAGGSTIVGERGPERVTLPKGTSITPANKTSQGNSVTFVINGNIFGMDNFKNLVTGVLNDVQSNQNMKSKYNLTI
jgi:hypothetical protein